MVVPHLAPAGEEEQEGRAAGQEHRQPAGQGDGRHEAQRPRLHDAVAGRLQAVHGQLDVPASPHRAAAEGQAQGPQGQAHRELQPGVPLRQAQGHVAAAPPVPAGEEVEARAQGHRREEQEDRPDQEARAAREEDDVEQAGDHGEEGARQQRRPGVLQRAEPHDQPRLEVLPEPALQLGGQRLVPRLAYHAHELHRRVGRPGAPAAGATGIGGDWAVRDARGIVRVQSGRAAVAAHAGAVHAKKQVVLHPISAKATGVATVTCREGGFAHQVSVQVGV
mmetsp:Transcript_60187/g.189059  ORF Transcript_60187/g.189059 Transcript_60187/m.189059 type:complete len:278 (-) Transcript_60187:112-945(-)